jgi:hypothetical protein
VPAVAKLRNARTNTVLGDYELQLVCCVRHKTSPLFINLATHSAVNLVNMVVTGTVCVYSTVMSVKCSECPLTKTYEEEQEGVHQTVRRRSSGFRDSGM